MPHEWNNIMVVTQDELVPAYYNWPCLKLTLHRHENKPYGIKRVQKGGNGRQMLIAFDSLPAHVKEGLGDPRRCSHILENYYRTDPDAVTYFTTYTFEDGTSLKPEYQERYIINASVIKALFLLKNAREREKKTLGGSLVGIMDTILMDAISFNKTLKAKHGIEHTLPESSKRFKQALKDFQSEGYKSLISQKHRNDNALKVTDKTLALLNNMFAKDRYKPTPTELHRRYSAFLAGFTQLINSETGELYNPKEYKPLSESTVKSWMAQWANRIGNHTARSGDRQKLMGKYKTPHSMDRPEHAGSLISIDDRQPPFKCAELNGERIWFYNAVDVASEAFVCAVHGMDKKGIILDFYRQLVRNYHGWGFNLPAELEAEMNLNASYLNTFLREGAMFQFVRIEANNARGKYIEHLFNPIRHRMEKKLDGWQARPFDKRETHQAGPQKTDLIPYKNIVDGSVAVLEEWNDQPHPDKPEMSRWDYFKTHQNPNLKPTNYKAFLRHIGYRTATSCNVGIIRFKDQEWLLGESGKVATGHNLINLMRQAEGRDVDVYWLDDNDGKVFKALVYIDDQYICEAVAKPRYNRARIEQTDADLAARALMSAYENSISTFGKLQVAKLEEVTAIETPRPKTFLMPGFSRPEPAEMRPTGEILEEAVLDEADSTQVSYTRPIEERF